MISVSVICFTCFYRTKLLTQAKSLRKLNCLSFIILCLQNSSTAIVDFHVCCALPTIFLLFRRHNHSNIFQRTFSFLSIYGYLIDFFVVDMIQQPASFLEYTKENLLWHLTGLKTLIGFNSTEHGSSINDQLPFLCNKY